MPKRNLTEDEKREMATLKNSYEMFEKSKKEALDRNKVESVRRIEIAQDEIVRHMREIDPSETFSVEKAEEEPKEEKKPKKTATKKKETTNRLEEDKTVLDAMKRERAKLDEEKKNVIKSAKESSTFNEVEDIVKKRNTVIADNNMYVASDSSNAQYDLIPLPSNGEGYPSKTDRIPVAYLTAYDENLITSPNLYRDNLVIDFLIKNKVMAEDFDTDDLLSGDADAITWFLRTTSYGPDFPITVRDPETGEVIETTIDLSKLKTKEFNLKGDENGHFDFKLKKSGHDIKFRFLTRKDEKALQLKQELETEGIKAQMLDEIRRNVATILDNDEVLLPQEKDKIRIYNDVIKDWVNKLKKESDSPYGKIVTNRLEMQIQAVDGNYDRDYIKQFVMSMPAKDSLDLRRYIIDNEPGMDFEIEVERPESLGGGSFKTFLEWDYTVFLNIT